MIKYLIAVLENPRRDLFGRAYFQEAADMGIVKNSFWAKFYLDKFYLEEIIEAKIFVR